MGVTPDGLGGCGSCAEGGGRDPGGPAGPRAPGMLEVLLVVVAVEDGEAQHAAGDLLGLLLQLRQVLLGIICKRAGG